MTDAGICRSDRAGMAAELTRYWKEVFTGRGIDEDLLNQWLRDYEDMSPLNERQPFPVNDFSLKRNHIRLAIKRSNNSTPGPD